MVSAGLVPVSGQWAAAPGLKTPRESVGREDFMPVAKTFWTARCNGANACWPPRRPGNSRASVRRRDSHPRRQRRCRSITSTNIDGQFARRKRCGPAHTTRWCIPPFLHQQLCAGLGRCTQSHRCGPNGPETFPQCSLIAYGILPPKTLHCAPSPPPLKRTPRNRSPSVTPVAVKNTFSPETRSSVERTRSRS